MHKLKHCGLIVMSCASLIGCSAEEPAGIGSTEQALLLSPPGWIVNVETDDDYNDDTTPGGVVFYARTAPRHSGENHKWWIRVDVLIANGGGIPFNVTRFEVDTDVSTPVSRPLDDKVTINGGTSKTIVVPSGVSGSGAFPTSLTIKAFVEGYSEPMVTTLPSDWFVTSGPIGGYLFPLRPTEKGAGRYNSVSVHENSVEQKWAYDITAKRWNGSAWTSLVNDLVDGSANNHHIAFGQNIYSMRGGLIRRCYRSMPDQVPGVKVDGGGNTLIIDHGNGEYASYHHLKQNSIPAALCPTEGPVGNNWFPLAVPVGNGQYIGQIGNTGHSSGPHLHVQISGEAPSPNATTLRPLPLNFYAMSVHHYDGYNPDTDVTGWVNVNFTDPAALYSNMLMLNTW